MNGRERMEAILAGERPDRFPIKGIHGWSESIERWRREGLEDGAYDGRDVSEALGLIDPEGALGLSLDLNMVPRFPVKIISKDSEYVVVIDEFGVTKKLLRSDYDRSGGYKTEAGSMSSMSEWLDFPVKDLASWKEIYEERFRPDLTGRLPADWETMKSQFARDARVRWVTYANFPLFGLFGPMRELMGLEGLVFAMADNPHLVHTIVDDLTDFWLATFEQVLRDGVRLDQVTFFEDMCATKAPLIGPAMFREFLSAGYRKATGGLKDLGVSLFSIDSDGNAWDVLSEMMEAGINGFHPCEVQADMDTARLREAFPGLYLNGGIAKGALTKELADVEPEVARRFRIAWDKSRYTPSLDHVAPPDIPWPNLLEYARIYKICALKTSGTAGN